MDAIDGQLSECCRYAGRFPRTVKRLVEKYPLARPSSTTAWASISERTYLPPRMQEIRQAESRAARLDRTPNRPPVKDSENLWCGSAREGVCEMACCRAGGKGLVIFACYPWRVEPPVVELEAWRAGRREAMSGPGLACRWIVGWRVWAGWLACRRPCGSGWCIIVVVDRLSPACRSLRTTASFTANPEPAVARIGHADCGSCDRCVYAGLLLELPPLRERRGG
jgi:hypothetical protein